MHEDPLRRDTWYRDTWVNQQADQWRQGDVYPQQYQSDPKQSSLKRREQRRFRTPSPQRYVCMSGPSQWISIHGFKVLEHLNTC